METVRSLRNQKNGDWICRGIIHRRFFLIMIMTETSICFCYSILFTRLQVIKTLPAEVSLVPLAGENFSATMGITLRMLLKTQVSSAARLDMDSESESLISTMMVLKTSM